MSKCFIYVVEHLQDALVPLIAYFIAAYLSLEVNKKKRTAFFVKALVKSCPVQKPYRSVTAVRLNNKKS